MIKIEIEASNGAEVRQHLLALLGQTPYTQSFEYNPHLNAIPEEENVVEVKDLEPETVKEAVKEVTRKRRTKEQIAAEEAAANQPAAEETQNEETKEETSNVEEPILGDDTSIAPKLTAKDLQTKLVTLSRSGKSAMALQTLKSFGAESITSNKPLDPSKYDEFMAALEKL